MKVSRVPASLLSRTPPDRAARRRALDHKATTFNRSNGLSKTTGNGARRRQDRRDSAERERSPEKSQERQTHAAGEKSKVE